MKEDFLHYIWQHQYFDKTALCTTNGEAIQVLKTGFYHTDAGPDFKEALIRIGDVEWSGSVEVHINASDWLQHRHQTDRKYDQVILHVVWQADESIRRTNGSAVPTLELKDRIQPGMLAKYEQLQQAVTTIPCAAFWPAVPELTKTSMLARALTERLELKANDVLAVHQQLNNDWEQTAYFILCRSFGFKINQAAMEQLAKALPWQVIRKHQQSQFQLEALLFGQAGYLENPVDDYAGQLAKEYTFLSHKYKLRETALQRHHWNFLRMRPANFPTVRLAQLAATLYQQQTFFTKLLETQSIKTYESYFTTPVSAYWQQHYDFGKPLKTPQLQIGKSSVQNLIVNVTVPLLAAYATYNKDYTYLEKAISLLEHVKEASNNITRLYEALGWRATSAADNQAALGLYKLYCEPVNCLQCAVGNKILKNNTAL